MDINAILEAAIKASLAAGEAILEVYGEDDFAVETKKDNSPVTIADKKAQAVIHSILDTAFPEIPFLGEESREIPYNERKNWEYFFLVDPLDGTKEFIKRNGEFTVNIALIHNSKPVAGVIYAPVPDTLYFGSRETGVFKVESVQSGMGNAPALDSLKSKGKNLPLASVEERLEAREITIVASRSHLSKETEIFIEEMKKDYQVQTISAGSSLKICLCAEGNAVFYPRFAPTSEWDTAAGQALIEAVGGKMVHAEDFEKPLVYNKENLLNPWFLVDMSEVGV